jgi:hypothetical protein
MPVELHPNFRVAGSSPAGVANRLRSSVGRAERQFHNELVVTHRTKLRRMPDGTTAQMGCSVRFDSSLQALSGTSGTPGFHLLLSPRRTYRSMIPKSGFRFLEKIMLKKWRMQAGLQVARPSKDGRSGVQITLSLHGAGWRSQASSCRSLSPAD